MLNCYAKKEKKNCAVINHSCVWALTRNVLLYLFEKSLKYIFEMF